MKERDEWVKSEERKKARKSTIKENGKCFLYMTKTEEGRKESDFANEKCEKSTVTTRNRREQHLKVETENTAPGAEKWGPSSQVRIAKRLFRVTKRRSRSDRKVPTRERRSF